MNKLDIVIPGLIIGVVVISGVFFLLEWEQEQIAYNLLSDEDKAMMQLAENLRKTSDTNCNEMAQVLEINTHPILEKAIIEKQKELGCN